MISKKSSPGTVDQESFELKFWMKHREDANKNKWYAIVRIDILIITLSSGGIYTIFEIVKFMKEQCIKIDIALLKIAGGFFVVTLMINFMSQIFGELANKHEAIYAKFKIREERKQSVTKREIKKEDTLVTRYNDGVLVTNVTSILTMMIGLICLLLFLFWEL